MVRSAASGDARDIALFVLAAQESWLEWADPASFTPYTLEHPAHQWESRIADPNVVTLVGDRGGVVSFGPESNSYEPSRTDSASAHLSSLFVIPTLHGTGLAQQLHDSAIHAAAGLGYQSMRLWVPSEAGRARSFYERNGWAATGTTTEFAGLVRTEYRRELKHGK